MNEKPTITLPREQWDRLARENVALRYLCALGLPQVQPGALVPGETGRRRLDYLIATVDYRAALDWQNRP